MICNIKNRGRFLPLGVNGLLKVFKRFLKELSLQNNFK